MRKYLMQILLSLIISFGTISVPSTAEAKTNYINTVTYKIEKQQTVVTILFSKKTNSFHFYEFGLHVNHQESLKTLCVESPQSTDVWICFWGIVDIKNRQTKTRRT